jgi:hypothetical protein
MEQVLRGCARTTVAVRRAIQHGQQSLYVPAEQYGINSKSKRGLKTALHCLS